MLHSISSVSCGGLARQAYGTTRLPLSEFRQPATICPAQCGQHTVGKESPESTEQPLAISTRSRRPHTLRKGSSFQKTGRLFSIVRMGMFLPTRSRAASNFSLAYGDNLACNSPHDLEPTTEWRRVVDRFNPSRGALNAVSLLCSLGSACLWFQPILTTQHQPNPLRELWRKIS
jgi:hypothetical protein